MKKLFDIKIDDPEFFYLDEVLAKVKMRHKKQKELSHNKEGKQIKEAHNYECRKSSRCFERD